MPRGVRFSGTRSELARQMQELEEEHGGEDGLLAEAENDKGKLSAKSVKVRLAEIKGDKDTADERKLLSQYLMLAEKEAEAGAVLKEAQRVLDGKVGAKYPKLTVDEIKALVVDDKWFASIEAAVQGELDRVSQALAGRTRQLADRYAMPLPRLAGEVDALGVRVNEQLRKMGFAWN